MRAPLCHIQINVSDARGSLPFYTDLLSYLGYKEIAKGDGYIGMGDGATDLWLMETDERYRGRGFHRKATGLNHVAFRASSKSDVDRFVREFLEKRKIKPLYDSPKEFPEYSKGYYAVYFEGPDRLKIELAYWPAEHDGE